jgi:hypothetical protein
MDVLEGRAKGQPALEFLSTYVWVLITIILFVVIVSVLATSETKASYPPSHCYITPALPCYGAFVMTNSIGTESYILLTNDLNRPVIFPTNSFGFDPVYSNKTYYGQCIPSVVGVGDYAVCNASLAGYNPSIGTELGPNFFISYIICADNKCLNPSSTYNTSGSAQLTVSPYSPLALLNVLGLVLGPGAGGSGASGNLILTCPLIFSSNGYSNTLISPNCGIIKITGNGDNLNIATGAYVVNAMVTGNSDSLNLRTSAGTVNVLVNNGGPSNIIVTNTNYNTNVNINIESNTGISLFNLTNGNINLDITGNTNHVTLNNGVANIIITGNTNQVTTHGTTIGSLTLGGHSNCVNTDCD